MWGGLKTFTGLSLQLSLGGHLACAGCSLLTVLVKVFCSAYPCSLSSGSVNWKGAPFRFFLGERRLYTGYVIVTSHTCTILPQYFQAPSNTHVSETYVLLKTSLLRLSVSVDFPAEQGTFYFGEQAWCSSESARLPPLCPGFDSPTQHH